MSVLEVLLVSVLVLFLVPLLLDVSSTKYSILSVLMYFIKLYVSGCGCNTDGTHSLLEPIVVILPQPLPLPPLLDVEGSAVPLGADGGNTPAPPRKEEDLLRGSDTKLTGRTELFVSVMRVVLVTVLSLLDLIVLGAELV